jgi:hypothetical protein
MNDRELPYNRSLAALESVLACVERPGDFCTHGALTLPLPVVRVDGVGTLALPLLEAQAAALIDAAERAPYGTTASWPVHAGSGTRRHQPPVA